MGPVLHWRVGVDQHTSMQDNIEWINTVKMATYIIERIEKLSKTKNAKLSRLELEDLRDFSKWATEQYEDPLMYELGKTLYMIETLLKSKHVVDDTVKNTVRIGRVVVDKRRFKNRALLLGIYDSTLQSTKLVKESTSHTDEFSHNPISEKTYKLHLEDRAYVQHLIDSRMFRKCDIKRAFPTDIFKEFDRFKKAYLRMDKKRTM